MPDLSLGEAARALGVSVDTLRRWDRDGKLETTRDERNRRRVPAREVDRLRAHPERHHTGDALSTRNRFPGVVTSVEVDGVMALVEIEAGPHRVTAAITRDAVEELGLAEGVEATAMVKATSVMVERGRDAMRRSPSPASRWSRRSGPAAATIELGLRTASPLVVVRRRLARARLHRLRGDGGNRREAVVRRLRRPRRPDPPGRDARTSTRPPTRASPTTSTPTAWSRSRSSSRPTRWCSRVPEGSEIDSLDDLTGDVTLAIGDEGVPVGDYTREVLARLPNEPGRGDPRQRALARARRRRDRRQAHPGRGRRGLRLHHRRRRHRRRAGGDPSCRRLCSPTSPTAPPSSTGAANPEGAQSFIDGLLAGDGATALEDAGFGPPPRLSRCDTAARSRSCWSPRSRSRSRS